MRRRGLFRCGRSDFRVLDIERSDYADTFSLLECREKLLRIYRIIEDDSAVGKIVHITESPIRSRDPLDRLECVMPLSVSYEILSPICLQTVWERLSLECPKLEKMYRNERNTFHECDRVQRQSDDTQSREWSRSIHDSDLRNGKSFEEFVGNLRKRLKFFPMNRMR